MAREMQVSRWEHLGDVNYGNVCITGYENNETVRQLTRTVQFTVDSTMLQEMSGVSSGDEGVYSAMLVEKENGCELLDIAIIVVVVEQLLL